MKFRSDLHVGRAGQHIAAADFLSEGHDPFSAAEGMPYDLVVDVDGRLLRVQVKTTREPKATTNRAFGMPGYIFHVRRCGKGGRQSYTVADVDLFALVALDEKSVGYIAASQMPTTFFVRPESQRGQYDDERIVARNKVIYDRLMAGETPADLGKEYGLDRSYVGRLKFGRARTFVSGFYMADLTLENALSALAANDNQRIGSSKKSFLNN